MWGQGSDDAGRRDELLASGPEEPLTVRGLLAGDEQRLVELFELCFGRHRTLEEFRWRYQRTPLPTKFHLATIGGRIVGAEANQRLPAWLHGHRAEVSRGTDLMVDPACRRRGVFRRMRPAIRSSQRAAPVTISFPAEVTFRLGATTLNQVGRLPQWIRWERTASLHSDRPAIPRVVAGCAASAARLAARGASLGVNGLRCREIGLKELEQHPEQFDRLAQRSKHIANGIVCREAVYIHWRWLSRPEPWRVVIVERRGAGNGTLEGYIAFRPGEGDCRIGDLLALEPRAMRALLGAVAAESAAEKPGRTIIELNDPRPWSRRVLYQCGFLPRGTGPLISIRAMQAGVPPSLERSSGWYLTASDTDLV